VGVEARTWQESVIASGELLEAAGAVSAEYTAQMVRVVEDLGPYIVISPGIALAHSRPGPAVMRAALSMAILAGPVEFGHATNDPVRLVLGLSAVDHDSHLVLMSQLAPALADAERLQRILRSTSARAARDALVGA
jgi:PTS system ascorbate-specific IIA component